MSASDMPVVTESGLSKFYSIFSRKKKPNTLPSLISTTPLRPHISSLDAVPDGVRVDDGSWSSLPTKPAYLTGLEIEARTLLAAISICQ